MSFNSDFDKRFRRTEKGIKTGMGVMIFINVAIFVLVIIGISVLISRCERELEENGTTFIEQVGREVKEVKDEFNKGFAPDTIVVDSLKAE